MKTSPLSCLTPQPPRTRTAASLAAGAALLSIATISPAHADSVRFSISYYHLEDNDWQEVEQCARAEAESYVSQLLIGLDGPDVDDGICFRRHNVVTGKRFPTDPVAYAIARATELEMCPGVCHEARFRPHGEKLTTDQRKLVQQYGLDYISGEPDVPYIENAEARSLAESNERKARKIAARVLRAAMKNCSKLEQMLLKSVKVRRDCSQVSSMLVLRQ